MTTLKRTTSEDEHFRNLVKQLDADLHSRNGESDAYYAQFNKIDMIKHAVVGFEEGNTVGCGAIKQFAIDAMEVKRMFVPVPLRGKGIAKLILAELENWTRELGYKKCVLETGKQNPEAMSLYLKSGYKVIPNYGQYINIESSVCFEKVLD